MPYSVPNHLIYRYYGDDSILINNRSKKTVFLTSKAQTIWRQLLETKTFDIENLPILQKLCELGFVDDKSVKPATTKQISNKTFETSELSAINLWSFRNNIPISGHFELTGRCNLRCLHCYCTFEQKRDALSTQDVFKIIDDFIFIF